MTGEPDQELAEAQQAARQAPDDPAQRLRLGAALLRLDRAGDAAAEFTALLHRNPTPEHLDLVLGVLARHGQPAQVDELVPAVVAAAGTPLPDVAAERDRELLSLRADVAGLMRDADRHQESFELAMSLLRKDFHDLRCYTAALACAWHLHRNADGLGLARDAHSRYPTVPMVLWFQAVFLLELGRAAEAVETASAYLELAPEQADGYTVLGKALLDCGRDAEAEQALTEALRLDPDDAQAREFLAQLGS